MQRRGPLGRRADRIDPVTQITREHMSITATTTDGTIRTVSDVVPNRFWTATELTAAVRLGRQLHGSEARATATSTTARGWPTRPRGG